MEELVAIISIFVILPAIIVSAVSKVKQAKYEAQARSGTGDGLRASELQRLIREAVADAVEPLQARLDAMERSAETRPGHLDPAVLSDALEIDLDRNVEGDEVAAVRRRTRS